MYVKLERKEKDSKNLDLSNSHLVMSIYIKSITSGKNCTPIQIMHIYATDAQFLLSIFF